MLTNSPRSPRRSASTCSSSTGKNNPTWQMKSSTWKRIWKRLREWGRRPSFTWMLVRISDFTFAERSEHRLLLSISKEFGLRIFSQCSRCRSFHGVVILALISQFWVTEMVKFNFKVYRLGHGFMGPGICELFILTTICCSGTRIFFSSKFILRSSNLL